MNYYAHSPKDGIPSQPYLNHVRNVHDLANNHLRNLEKYACTDRQQLLWTVDLASIYHDLGKLNAENQEVLSKETKKRSLPVNHVDAGSAHLLTGDAIYAASVVHAHHHGFPDFPAECNKEKLIFRDEEIAADVDKELPALLQIHTSLFGPALIQDEGTVNGCLSVFLRLALSCIVDADHTDTTANYHRESLLEKPVELRAAERLAQLDAYISQKPKGDDPKRTALRQAMYHTCRNAEISENISSCDSPVGSGKTTAVMAHLLSQAQKCGLRRIFVVLPFTNIITQSVNTYREALVLPGENPEEVVAELHHRADFENEDIRHLTARWKAPIIVTTAVTFFETLASNSPATLRRLHELPGSAIFVDESHAALPAELLPLAWRWMEVYADEWDCYWVLASGSLTRFWQIPVIAGTHSPRNVPEIVDDHLRSDLLAYETGRIRYQSDLIPKTVEELTNWILQFPGPRLVILNTVQSAAVLANHFQKICGRGRVEHLSTALTAMDRARTLERVDSRLKQKEDTDWTFIATSCVEAGVNLSFRTGFREVGSVSSLLQASGRVNREGLFHDSEMWSFCIVEGKLLIHNPGLQAAGSVLKKYLERNEPISPALSTQAISDELSVSGKSSKKFKKLLKSENSEEFRVIESEFKVIDTDTVLAVVDSALAERLRFGNMNWRELQMMSVQIAKTKLIEYPLPQIREDIYHWNYGYDDFLGYMAGFLKLKKLSDEDLFIT